MQKHRRSKYGFAALIVGNSFEIEAIDYASMNSSLTKYNKKHGVKIVVETIPGKGTKLKVHCISITDLKEENKDAK